MHDDLTERMRAALKAAKNTGADPRVPVTIAVKGFVTLDGSGTCNLVEEESDED